MRLVFLLLWFFSPIVLIPSTIILFFLYQKEKKERTKFHNTAARLYREDRLSEQEYKNLIFPEENSIVRLKQNTINIPQKTDVNKKCKSIKNSFEGVKEKSPIEDSFKDSKEEFDWMKNSKETVQHSIRAVHIILVLGVLFILIAGLIFATTTWKMMNDMLKTGIIGSVTVLFFGSSAIAEKKFQLKHTGSAFYVLGCLFIPIVFLAVSYFKLAGDWFCLTGGGRCLFLSVSFLSFSFVTMIGMIKYSSVRFLWVSGGAFSYGVGMLISQTAFFNGVWAFIFSAYSLLLLFFGETLFLFCTKPIKKESIKLLNTNFISFTQFNLYIAGFMITVFCGFGFLSVLSALFLSVGFLVQTFKSETNAEYKALPFAILIYSAFFKIGYDNGRGSILFFAALSSIVMLLLNEMKMLNKAFQKVLFSIESIFLILLFIASILLTCIDFTFDIFAFSAIVLLLLSITWCILRQGQKWLIGIHPVLLTILFLGAVKLWFSEGNPTFLWAVFSLGAYGGYRISERSERFSLWSPVSAFFFPFLCFVLGGVELINGYSDYSLLLWSACFVMLLAEAFRKEKCTGSVIAITVMPWIFYCITIPFSKLFFIGRFSEVFFAFYIVSALFLIGILLREKKRETNACFEYSFLSALCVMAPIASFFVKLADKRWWFLYCWVITIVWAIELLQSIRQKPCAVTESITKTTLFYITAIGGFFSPVVTVYAVIPGVKLILLCYIPGIIGTVLFGIWQYFREALSKSKFINHLYRLFTFAIHFCVVTTSILLLKSRGLPIEYFFGTTVILILCQAALFLNQNTTWGVISVIFVYPLVLRASSLFLSDSNINKMLVVFVYFIMGALSWRLYPKVYFYEKKDSFIIRHIDWYGILNLFAPVYLFFSNSPYPYWRFFAVLLGMIYVLQFYKRWEGVEDKLILSIAAILLCFSVWIQPFFTVIRLLRTEYDLLIFILYSFFFYIIWKEKKKWTHFVLFATAIFCIVRQYIDIIIFSEPVDALILGIVCLLLLFISFMKKNKYCFLLCSVTLVLLVVYMSRSFWLSIAWWIYLLTAGILLIVVAAVNEKERQKGSSLSKKIIELLKKWNWQ